MTSKAVADHSGWASLPVVLSTAELAGLLHLNPKTVHAMVRDGRLPARRVPGSRRFQFVTAEVIAALRRPEIAGDRHPVAAATVDPCDVWGPAPAAADCQGRLGHWIRLATEAGLSTTAVETARRPARRARSEGFVEVDGLVYEVLSGPRQRVRVVDGDGEAGWELIDAVWVEPVCAAPRAPEAAATCAGPTPGARLRP